MVQVLKVVLIGSLFVPPSVRKVNTLFENTSLVLERLNIQKTW